MKKSHLERIVRRNPQQYESIIDLMAGGVKRCGFSGASNAWLGPREMARCAVDAAAGKGNLTACARARRDAMESAGRTDIDVPSGEWIRQSLSKMTPDGAVESLFEFNTGIITLMRRRGLLKSRMDVGIDFHNVRRFDKKPGPELVRGGDKASMTKALYETYGTVQILVNGQRLVVGMVTFSAGDDHAGVVRALLDACARHGIRVGTVMADRGFFSQGVMKVLNDSGVMWLMPCPNTVYVKGALDEFEAGRRDRVSDAVITSSDRQECPYTMSIVPRRARRKKRDADGCTDEEPWEKHISFATNDPDIDVEEYSRRWGIETGYRLLESMRITTRSRHHGSRVMCMAMTIMLFNSWILVDALMRLDCKAQGTKTMIRLYSMLSILLELMMKRGPGPPKPP